MIIQESVEIYAGKDKVWETFNNVEGWGEWNSVLRDALLSSGMRLDKGKRFGFCIRPYLFPVRFEPVVEELVEHRKVTWVASKCGIVARHEFFFWPRRDRVVVTSRETFTSFNRTILRLIFPRKKARKLTRNLLEDLKRAAES